MIILIYLIKGDDLMNYTLTTMEAFENTLS